MEGEKSRGSIDPRIKRRIWGKFWTWSYYKGTAGEERKEGIPRYMKRAGHL